MATRTHKSKGTTSMGAVDNTKITERKAKSRRKKKIKSSDGKKKDAAAKERMGEAGSSCDRNQGINLRCRVWVSRILGGVLVVN